MAALPSLVFAARGPDLIHDDFGVAYQLERDGIWEGTWKLAFDTPARPGSAIHYLAVYQGIGDHPVLQALLLGLLNAVVAVGVWFLARRLMTARVAMWVALAFALAPNRGAARMWVNIGPYLVALALVLLGAGLLVHERSTLAAVASLTAGVLVYDGVALLALLVLAYWVISSGVRLRSAVWASAPVATASALLYLISPKRDYGNTQPFAEAWSLIPAQLGVGMWGSTALAAVAGVGILTAMVLALAACLPSFFSAYVRERNQVLAGIALLAAGAIPFVFAGITFGTHGIAERHNLVASLGVAVVVGTMIERVQRAAPRLGALIGIGVVSLLAIGNRSDVDRYVDAVEEGEKLFSQMIDDVGLRDERVVVVPSLPHTDGVAQFIHPADLRLALQYRDDRRWKVWMPSMPSDCQALYDDPARNPVVFDRETGAMLDEVPRHRCGHPSSRGT